MPGVGDTATVKALSSALEAPLNVLYQPGEHTFAGLAEAGAARVSTGSLLFRVAWQAVIQTANLVKTAAVVADPNRRSYADVVAALSGSER